VIYLLPILVILGALMDGFYDEGKKLLSSTFKSLFIGCISLLVVPRGNYMHIIYFLLCWWVLFDIIYNIVRKQKLFYVGNTKWTDKLLRWACDNIPVLKKFTRGNYLHVSFITKLMALTAAVGMILKGAI